MGMLIMLALIGTFSIVFAACLSGWLFDEKNE